MLRRPLALFVAAIAAVVLLSRATRGDEPPAAAPCACDDAGKLTFDDKESLAGWTITGDVGVDLTKGRDGKGGSLRIGPGGKALKSSATRTPRARSSCGSTTTAPRPRTPRPRRVGPRWGLVQSDGKLLAVGILYASYLGGDEGYTATACDGKDWFDQLFWLGVNAPAGRLAQVDLRLRSRGGPPGPAQRQGGQRRRFRQGRPEGLHAPSPSGATTARATGRRSGSTTSPSRWAARRRSCRRPARPIPTTRKPSPPTRAVQPAGRRLHASTTPRRRRSWKTCR